MRRRFFLIFTAVPAFLLFFLTMPEFSKPVFTVFAAPVEEREGVLPAVGETSNSLDAISDVASVEEKMRSRLSGLDMSEIQDFVNMLDGEIKGAIPQVDFKELAAGVATGSLDWSLSGVFTGMLHLFFKEVAANLALLGKLVVLVVICAILQNLGTAFERATTGKLTYAVVYLVLITIAVGSFALAVNVGREAVNNMVGFLQALMPLLLTLLVGVGGVASAAIFHPVIFMALSAAGTVIKNVIFPLVFFAAILGIVSNITEKFQVSKLAGLFKTAAMSLMGIFSTIFLGLLAIKGVASAVGDSVTLRTAKFATDAFIPVVGGMFADALESVVSMSLLIKNAVGIAGMIIIFFLTAVPLIKILAVAFIYKLAGALIQPVGDERTADCLNDLGNSLITVFAAVGTMGLLFFFAVAIVVGIGDLTVMLR